jgi:hypothetical protein
LASPENTHGTVASRSGLHWASVLLVLCLVMPSTGSTSPQGGINRQWGVYFAVPVADSAADLYVFIGTSHQDGRYSIYAWRGRGTDCSRPPGDSITHSLGLARQYVTCNVRTLEEKIQASASAGAFDEVSPIEERIHGEFGGVAIDLTFATTLSVGDGGLGFGFSCEDPPRQGASVAIAATSPTVTGYLFGVALGDDYSSFMSLQPQSCT